MKDNLGKLIKQREELDSKIKEAEDINIKKENDLLIDSINIRFINNYNVDLSKTIYSVNINKNDINAFEISELSFIGYEVNDNHLLLNKQPLFLNLKQKSKTHIYKLNKTSNNHEVPNWFILNKDGYICYSSEKSNDGKNDLHKNIFISNSLDSVKEHINKTIDTYYKNIKDLIGKNSKMWMNYMNV